MGYMSEDGRKGVGVAGTPTAEEGLSIYSWSKNISKEVSFRNNFLLVDIPR
jgi:hypothetical protein